MDVYTDVLITRADAFWFNTDDVDQRLVACQLGHDFALVHRLGREHDDVAKTNNLADSLAQQRADVRDYFIDVLAIRTHQATERHVIVPDLHLAAFRDQPFDELYCRALAQVIGTSLETEPEDTDLLLPCPQDRLHRPLQVF